MSRNALQGASITNTNNRNNMKNYLQSLTEQGVKVLYSIPKNWHIIEGATTAPRGYVWICNSESRFYGKYEHALLKIRDNEK